MSILAWKYCLLIFISFYFSGLFQIQSKSKFNLYTCTVYVVGMLKSTNDQKSSIYIVYLENCNSSQVYEFSIFYIRFIFACFAYLFLHHPYSIMLSGIVHVVVASLTPKISCHLKCWNAVYVCVHFSIYNTTIPISNIWSMNDLNFI